MQLRTSRACTHSETEHSGRLAPFVAATPQPMRRLRSTARPTVSAALWVGYALDGAQAAVVDSYFRARIFLFANSVAR